MIPILAAGVLLAWDATGDVLFYRIYYGKGTATPTTYMTVNAPTQSLQVNGLAANVQYKFVATAIDSQGVESAKSNEVLWTTPK